ncbi:MAG: hypothetical protein AAF581_17895 [Planctomycetota bacterium]
MMRSRLWLWMLGCVLSCSMASGQVINEIRSDQDGSDTDEYFEIFGPAGTSLDGIFMISIGDGAGGSGIVENVTDLTGNAIPGSGFFLVAETSPMPILGATPDLVASLAYENDDNVTHLLVENFTGLPGDDLDTNDDGVLDTMPWSNELDRIAMVEEANPPTATEFHYGPPEIGPIFAVGADRAPGHIWRCPDGTGAWMGEAPDGVVTGNTDTAGGPNTCSNCPQPMLGTPVSDCVANTVTLSWAMDAWMSIEVFRDGSSIAMLGGGATSYVDTTPVIGTNHSYEVVGTCASGFGGSSVSVAHCVCPDITLVSCSADCVAGTVDLVWSNNGNTFAGGIEVRRNGSMITTLGTAAESYVDMPPANGTYTYEIIASCGGTLMTSSITCGVLYCVSPPAVTINEIRIDDPSTDNEEYFELSGPPSAALTGISYIVIGEGTGGSGVIELVLDLSAYSIGASGFFTLGDAGGLTLGTPDVDFGSNNLFENSDNVTHLLVANFSGANGDDLDTNDDGVLDATPWDELDRIALVEEPNPPTSTEFHYGPPQIGPDFSFVPGHVYRCPDGTGPWFIGDFTPGVNDTLGATNGSCMGLCETPQLSTPIADCVANTVTLNWLPGTWASIEVRRDGMPIAVGLPGTDVMYVDTTPVQGSTYFYEVVGTCQGAMGMAGVSVDFCTCPPIASFAASSDCVANTVLVSWGANAYNSIELFRDGASIAMLPGTATDFLDTTVAIATTYSYEVVGDCGTMGTSSATLSHDHCVCDAPTALNCSVGATDVMLTWDNNGLMYAGGIEVFRNGASVATLGGGAQSYTDVPPVAGAYTYEVVATCIPDSASVTCGVLFGGAPAPLVTLSEIRINSPHQCTATTTPACVPSVFLDEEYFELAGAPGTSLAGLTYVVLGDGAAGAGVVEFVLDLGAYAINANGFFVAAEDVLDGSPATSSVPGIGVIGTHDVLVNLNFENGDDVTHMLVANFSGADGQDLDTDDDGVLDITPWDSVVDSVGADSFFDAGQLYGFENIDQVNTGATMLARCPGSLAGGEWRPFTFGTNGVVDTPGTANACPSCFEILDLVCSVDCATGDTVLTWVNGSNYTNGITVTRDGMVLATLPAGTTTYSDPNPGANSYVYDVQGDCSMGSTQVSCNLLSGGQYTGQTNVIYEGEMAGGSVASAVALEDSLSQLGQATYKTGDLEGFVCSTQLGCGDVLWVMLGTFPNRHFLTQAEGQLLVDVLSQGASVYLEGAGAHAFAPTTPFDDYNGLDDTMMLLPGAFGADDSLTELDGLMFDSLDFTAAVNIPYMQDNAAGEDFTDALIADTAGTDIPDGQAGLLWRNSPDALPDPLAIETDYGVASYFKTDGANGGTYGDVITSSFELGGYNNGDLLSIQGLVSDYLAALTSPVCGPVGDEFQRGDCNNDDSKNIADPVRLLNFLFPPAPPPTPLDCGDACDANDDGSLNIADAVAMLSTLFPTGPPIAWIDPDLCGLDPTADSIDCVGYSHCP